jgi:hypothetical protein
VLLLLLLRQHLLVEVVVVVVLLLLLQVATRGVLEGPHPLHLLLLTVQHS